MLLFPEIHSPNAVIFIPKDPKNKLLVEQCFWFCFMASRAKRDQLTVDIERGTVQRSSLYC